MQLGCHGLPVAMGRRSGIPRSARLCPHCHDGNVGDELHMVFECSFLQPLRKGIRVQYANLFSMDIAALCLDSWPAAIFTQFDLRLLPAITYQLTAASLL